jgi:hypothetical protein
MNTPKKKKTLLINGAFLVLSIGILAFLLNAPDETTAKIPHDDDHNRFFGMGKKEAEKFCTECHTPEGVYPLLEDHPPKYRCLFCHKRD